MSLKLPNPASSPSDLDAIAKLLFGTALNDAGHVVHATSVWRDPNGDLRTILINKHAPISDLDWAVLHMARARTDAIITTGKNLRDEKKLRYDLVQTRWGEAMMRWRQSRWGRVDPPYLVALTRGKGLNFDHPSLRGWPRPLLFCPDRAAERSLCASGLTVISDEAPSIQRAITHCRLQLECKSVLIEAGPSTANTLYDPMEIDELWLSEFQGKLPKQAQGPTFFSLKELQTKFTNHTSADHKDTSGPWTFHRFTR